MTLKQQLVIVSLLALALPWAGWQYLREMEAAVRQGQVESLTATARAVGARIAADDALMRRLVDQSQPERSNVAPLYAELLDQAPLLDGWQEEWQSAAVVPVKLQSKPDTAEPARLFAGRFEEDLYLLVEVKDTRREFFNPQLGLAASDHLRLSLQRPGGGASTFALLSAAPGEVQVVLLQQERLSLREYQLRGQWQEVENGYQVELRLPYSWAQAGLILEVFQGETGALAATTGEAARRVVSPDPVLAATLQVFVHENMRLTLLSADGLLLARAGEFGSQRLSNAQTLSGRLLRWLLKTPGQSRSVAQSMPLPAEPYSLAQWLGASAAGVSGWAGVGPAVGEAYAGVVLAEQPTEALEVLVNSAAGRLLLYSALATLLVGAGLISYASYLSFRIRALSRAAHRAVDASGRIQSQFPVSRINDEIGDLSRSYAQLLARLRDYNAYLESLASKLSHELRTPVAVVRSSLDNLQQLPLDAQASVYAKRAEAGCDRLAGILTAMSAAARLEQSLESSEWEQVELKPLLEQLVEAYRGAYPSHRFELRSGSGESYPVRIVPELLVQLLDKLVDNACDFSPPDEVVALQLSQRDAWVVLQVINRGPPLPQAMQGRIFDSLVSVREGRGDEVHLGLGLHVARLIAQHHQGEILAFDDQKRGEVTFEIRLPKPDS